ncbi:MAG: hypothetical protein U5J98_04665 [Halobacteriales archaeon]|nr:hypothetical protein [Halobacteriales archaeon]
MREWVPSRRLLVMASDVSPDEIRTAEEFEAAMGDLLAAATKNDIDPRGSWVYRNGHVELDDWEVMVYELD